MIGWHLGRGKETQGDRDGESGTWGERERKTGTKTVTKDRNIDTDRHGETDTERDKDPKRD